MGENTKIGWCDHTFNPWIGCEKVSPGCLHCYAEAMNRRRRWCKGWGPGVERKRTSAATWRHPIKWNKEASGEFLSFQQVETCEGRIYRGTVEQMAALRIPYEDVTWAGPARPRVFSGSLCDLLDPAVPIEWLAAFLALVRVTLNLDWLLLTKRPGNWLDRVCTAMAYLDRNTPQARDAAEALADPEKFTRTPEALWCADWAEGKPPANVLVGTTVENQEQEKRIMELIKIPAAGRFLSVEPMLGPVDLRLPYWNAVADDPRFGGDFSGKPSIDWVICGGESGADARPMHPDWARSLRDQCAAAGVAFFFKQWGEWITQGQLNDSLQVPISAAFKRKCETWPVIHGGDSDTCLRRWRVGTEAAGRMLDGIEHSAFPVMGGAR